MAMSPLVPGLSWLVFVIFGLGGGMGLPLGMPPLPEDPLMAKIAPEQCLAYVSSTGMAAPDGNSANQTERLLAEPEVRTMVATLERALRAGMGRLHHSRNLSPGASTDDLADLVKLLLTRPWAVYVSSVEFPLGGRPLLRGGAALDCGQDAAKMKAKIEQVTRNIPPQVLKPVDIDGQQWSSVDASPDTQIVWGFRDKYFMVGVGKGEIEAMLKRAAGSPPKWLAQLREQLPVPRVSTVTFVNVKAAVAAFAPRIGPRHETICRALGLDNVTSLASVTGLDQKGVVDRTLLTIDGEPQGLLRLANVKPLAAADLAPIPSDATFAVAGCFQPEMAFDLIQEVLAKTELRPEAEMRRALEMMEADLGLKLRDELLKPFGHSLCLFDSPSEGGLLTGLTIVVSVKDAKQAAATQAKLLQRIESIQSRNATEETTARRRGPRIDKVDFAGRQICIVDPGRRNFMLAPSWCLTDKELIVALFPQSIKAYLSRSANFKSLADCPAVAEAFQGGAGPLKVVYCDSQRVFDLVYPIALAGVRLVENELRRGGIDLGGDWMPSAAAIRKHLAPAVTTVRRTGSGIEIVDRQTLPNGGFLSAAPMGAALLLPAVSNSRQAARRMQSANQMKMIGLAMHNYAQAHRTFPPAYKADKDGKPLLSWRVLILPYLEADAMYQQFHLDEPWNSEHNMQFIARMPAAYHSPNSRVAHQGKTNYLTVRNDKALFPGKKGIGFAEIRDGTSNTIMTIEVPDAKAVVWTKPDDFQYDEQDPCKGLMGKWPGGFYAGLADGSVRLLPASIDPNTLRALFTRNGGEPADWDRLDRH